MKINWFMNLNRSHIEPNTFFWRLNLNYNNIIIVNTNNNMVDARNGSILYKKFLILQDL